MPNRSEAIAQKMLEVNRANHYLTPKEQIELINKARRYNTFNKLSEYAEAKILDKNIKHELASWERIDDSQIIEEELKKGYVLMNYYSDEDELDTAQRIAERLIAICTGPQALFDKAISLYKYPAVLDDEKKKLRTKNSYLDALINWNTIDDRALSIEDIQLGYLLLYYFQKEGQLNLVRKIAQRLIDISKSKFTPEVQNQSTSAGMLHEQEEQKDNVFVSEMTEKSSNNTKFCRQCGAKLPVGSQFCNKCGKKVI
jgi:ribosomal protein L40E